MLGTSAFSTGTEFSVTTGTARESVKAGRRTVPTDERSFCRWHGLQLRNRVATVVRHPDICPVKSYTRGYCAHSECPERLARVCLQLGHTIAAGVRHPHVGPVKGHTLWVLSRRERAEHVACARL
jgi:hypothetical protein